MRRIVSILGIIVILALATTLLWRVYAHHTQGEPYQNEEPALVMWTGEKITLASL